MAHDGEDASFRIETTEYGLGLPIARWVAEAHHGSLTLESSGPEGSRFVVTMPAPGQAQVRAVAQRSERGKPL